MYEPMRARVLHWLNVPPEPHPPQGDPASLRVFRAGRNYFRLRLAGWGAAQVIALAGIVFWTTVLIEVERVARDEQRATAAHPARLPAAGAADRAVTSPPAKSVRQKWIETWRAGVEQRMKAAAEDPSVPKSGFGHGWAGAKRFAVEIALIMPPWVFPLVWTLKIVGFAVYLAQLLLTYVIRRLDYELRWYLVTDRSLRLRHGVWVVWETTMSFANIQQVTISQGPLQRVLGLANVKVDSAGGGSRSHERQRGEDMHVGYFHSVTNAEEIRDLILDRLRRFRESGLGDPEEKHAVLAGEMVAPAVSTETADALLAAAREFAAEARALRGSVDGLSAWRD